MAEGLSNFFGFIDILKGLPVVPKIIMFVGIVILLFGLFVGPFAFFHNPRISVGIGLMWASLSWREWEESRWQNPGPPYEVHWNFGRVFGGLVFGGLAAWLFRICYMAGR